MAIIYDIDTDKKVTPIMVRDAILKCFHEAHKEVIKEMNKNREFGSESEKDNFEKIQIDLIVQTAFDNVNVNFENPKKSGLIKVLNELAKFASSFRKPNIIKKHYEQIMELIKELD